MKYLIDTHILLWWRYEISKLSQQIRDILESDESEVYISYATIWELEIKASIGKLQIIGSDTIEQIIQEEVKENDFELLPIYQKHLHTIGSLEDHHKDPFDRMLIAQAIVEKMTLISYDTNVHKYNVSVLKG